MSAYLSLTFCTFLSKSQVFLLEKFGGKKSKTLLFLVKFATCRQT